MAFKDIIFDRAGGVATITLNRQEKYNAMTEHTLEEMFAAFEDAIDDASVGVIVLTGAGDHFCTGGDVDFEEELNPALGRRTTRRALALGMLMRQAGKPTIAKVRGYCLGGGNELNLLCDLTVAASSAQFGQVGPKIGSVPVWYVTQMLPLLVGEKRAREIVYLCKRYSAAEAKEMGWINAAVPEEELDRTVDEWCQEILKKSPQAIRLAKTSMNYFGDLAYPAFTHDNLLLSQSYATDEFHEGMQSFIEKRKPDWVKFRADGF